jgi:hypothetical protein
MTTLRKIQMEHLGEAIEKAARVLPEGYEMLIRVSRGSGFIELYDDQGNRPKSFEDGERLSSNIHDAIGWALTREGIEPC